MIDIEESADNRAKRRRLDRITTPIRRGVIRYLVVVLDMSQSAGEQDFKPSRMGISIKLLKVRPRSDIFVHAGIVNPRVFFLLILLLIFFFRLLLLIFLIRIQFLTYQSWLQEMGLRSALQNYQRGLKGILMYRACLLLDVTV